MSPWDLAGILSLIGLFTAVIGCAIGDFRSKWDWVTKSIIGFGLFLAVTFPVKAWFYLLLGG